MKTKLKKLIIFIIPVALVASGMVLFLSMRQNEKPEVNENIVQNAINISVEVGDELLYKGLENVNKKQFQDFENIKGGIVPHHDLASEMIADFFNGIKSQDIETIIILGPNHSNIGQPAISEKAVWHTLFGTVEQDNQIVNELKQKGLVSFDENNFTKEHSIKVLTPFIKYYLPEAKIVPIIFTTEFNDYDLLAQSLEKYLQYENTILISSIDFSHYLPKQEADKNDLETIEAIEKRDYQFLSKFNSDYLDSPTSIIVLLKAMDLINAENIDIIDHSNSASILGQNLNETTSYYTILFAQ